MMFSSGHMATFFIYLSIIIIFISGFFIPLGTTIWLLYFIPIMISSRVSSKTGIFSLTFLCSFLILVGFFIGPHGIDPSIAIVNRTLGVIVLWALAFFIDQRMAINEALKVSEYQFQTVFEQSPIGKEIVDPDGKIIKVNKAFLEMFGINEQEVNKLDLFNNPQMSPDTHAKLNHGASINYEEVQFNFDDLKERKLLKTNRSGIAYLYKIITPLFDSKKKITGFLLQVQDTTSKKKAEMNLRRAVSDLEVSNKELERFAYVASHDLQEPLRMIGSYTQLLAKRYKGKLDSDADDFISYAVEGANRMRQLINDLLTYSRITSRISSFVFVDFNELMGNVLANLSVQIKESKALVTFDQLPTIYADEIQIMQLFQNLINNAIKFKGENKPEICISCVPSDDEWIFSVKDNGIGIESIYHDRIFVIFQRLNNREEYPGTGIGLAICKKIVERHGGRIWVESKLNQGSNFYFTISKIRNIINV